MGDTVSPDSSTGLLPRPARRIGELKMHPLKMALWWSGVALSIVVIKGWPAIADWLEVHKDLSGWVQAVGSILAIPAAAWAALAPYRRQTQDERAVRVQIAELAAARVGSVVDNLRGVSDAVCKSLALPAHSGVVGESFVKATEWLASLPIPSEEQLAHLLHFPIPNIAHTFTDGLVLLEQAKSHLARAEEARKNLSSAIDAAPVGPEKEAAEKFALEQNKINAQLAGSSLRYAADKFAEVIQGFEHHFLNHPTIPVTRIEILEPTFSVKSS